MEIKDAVLKAAEDVLGLDAEEMKEYLDLNLVENGLIDSLGIVSLVNKLSSELKMKIEIKEFKTEDLKTLNNMIAALERIRG